MSPEQKLLERYDLVRHARLRHGDRHPDSHDSCHHALGPRTSGLTYGLALLLDDMALYLKQAIDKQS